MPTTKQRSEPATQTGAGKQGWPEMKGESEQHREGAVARTIEQQTAKLPSDTFLWAALGAMGVSAVLRMMGNKDDSLFIGQWVSTFLLAGIYNKIVKVAGSDRMTGSPAL